jgi:hypothetical protein
MEGMLAASELECKLFFNLLEHHSYQTNQVWELFVKLLKAFNSLFEWLTLKL